MHDSATPIAEPLGPHRHGEIMNTDHTTPTTGGGMLNGAIYYPGHLCHSQCTSVAKIGQSEGWIQCCSLEMLGNDVQRSAFNDVAGEVSVETDIIQRAHNFLDVQLHSLD